MAKLYFRYGAMGSSKTANALMVRFNYIEKGRSVLMLKSGSDTRDGKDIISSRIGLSVECVNAEKYLDDMINCFDLIIDENDFRQIDDLYYPHKINCNR